MSNVAFLGLGAMGSRMARHLIAAGHRVTVWNRTRERADSLRDAGAVVARTPREAASGADIVLAMVRDDAASRSIWLDTGHGALAGLGPTAIAVECSTLSLDWARELAMLCARRNVGFVDAPVVGSRPQADGRQLIFLAGGAEPVVAQVEPVLLAMGAAVHRAGPNGAGAAAKLAVNTMFATQVAALAELIEAARRHDIDPARMIEIVTATPVCSPSAKGAAGAMLLDAFPPMFPIEIVEKDLGYAMSLAGGSGGASLVSATRDVFARAMRDGHGEDNITGVVQVFRQAA